MATSGNISSEGQRTGGARFPQAGDAAPPLVDVLPWRYGERNSDGRDEGELPTVVALFAEAEAEAGGVVAAEPERELIRGGLRALGAVLVALSPRSAWLFRPDDDVQVQAPVSPEERAVERVFDRFGVESRMGLDLDDMGRPAAGDGTMALRGLFVVDGRGIIRFAHRLAPAERITLGAAVQAASRATLLLPAATPQGASRREFLLASLVTGFAVAVAEGCVAPPPRTAASLPVEEVALTLEINGQQRALRVEPRVSLLDALRENLGLTGTKKGCDHGQCGACTVLVDGRRVLACLTLAATAEGTKITTIEGLATPEALHPMQAAFVAEDALQCGYCTPGQIMSAVGMLSEGHASDDDDIRELMSGNICRCGAYPNIVTAIRRARGEMAGGGQPKGAS